MVDAVKLTGLQIAVLTIWRELAGIRRQLAEMRSESSAPGVSPGLSRVDRVGPDRTGSRRDQTGSDRDDTWAVGNGSKCSNATGNDRKERSCSSYLEVGYLQRNDAIGNFPGEI